MDRIARLNQILTSNPNDSFAQHALALEYIKLGKDEEAKNIFVQLLQTNADYVGSYYHLAKVWERLGNNEKAIETYERGMQKAKEAGDGHAYNELQAAYEDLTY